MKNKFLAHVRARFACVRMTSAVHTYIPGHHSCRRVYTDTDRLIYYIECVDVYENMKRDINRFDTSDYPIDKLYGIPLVNEKSTGFNEGWK